MIDKNKLIINVLEQTRLLKKKKLYQIFNNFNDIYLSTIEYLFLQYICLWLDFMTIIPDAQEKRVK